MHPHPSQIPFEYMADILSGHSNQKINYICLKDLKPNIYFEYFKNQFHAKFEHEFCSTKTIVANIFECNRSVVSSFHAKQQ